jgi:D-Ala-D-Ala carboxypeptidase 3 (S13) family protein
MYTKLRGRALLMILARPGRLKALSLLLTFILTCSLAFAEPAGRGPKKQTSRKSARATKKANTRSSKSVARGRSSRSRVKVARGSRKRGRQIARRGRGRRGRWRGQVASRTASYNHSGIHKFLTDSWTMTPMTAAKPTPPGQSDPTLGAPVNPMSEAAQPIVTRPPAQANPAVAPADQPAEGDEQIIPINPLVLAFSDSLALRGYDVENQGFIVSTMGGEILAEQNADRKFNPASVVKIATSLTAISKLGPDFRYRTSMYTDGTFDPATGTLNGSLYVIGSGDPAFFHENALMIADKLNRSGIRAVEGNLVVLGQFYFNFSASREASARAFRTWMTAESWTPAVKSAYPRFLAMRAYAERGSVPTVYTSSLPDKPPSIKISGQTIADPGADTSNLRLLAVHTSLPLVRVLKGLNDFSNNWMASMIGGMVGGPDAVQRFLEQEVGLKGEELNIVTSSGLGSNYISPRGTLHILRKLITYLNNRGLKLEEILPVGGVDAGTLQRRFTDAYRGSVVAKTGTLSGVSALAGVAYTRSKGPLLFVIYNRGGSVSSFRAAQDETIKKLITFFGGPVPVRYVPMGGPGISETPAQTTQMVAPK